MLRYDPFKRDPQECEHQTILPLHVIPPKLVEKSHFEDPALLANTVATVTGECADCDQVICFDQCELHSVEFEECSYDAEFPKIRECTIGVPVRGAVWKKDVKLLTLWSPDSVHADIAAWFKAMKNEWQRAGLA